MSYKLNRSSHMYILKILSLSLYTSKENGPMFYERDSNISLQNHKSQIELL